MIIKVSRYELHHQTDDSKPFVLYTIQIENRKKKKGGGGVVGQGALENAELSGGDFVPLDYSSPFDREYKYSYVEEFDDEFSSHSETTSNGGGHSSPNHHQHHQHHHHEISQEICGFMEHSDWTVTKRYSELYDFHQRFIEISSLQNSKDMKSLFPKKLIIGNLKKENIERRIEQFNEYFKKMVEVILHPHEDNPEVQKLVTHFFSKIALVASESNPSKHPNKNVDWMIHKPNSRNNWFFSAPLGFEKFSTSFDRRAEYISPIFQNISIETLINIWEKFISKQKSELVDSNHDIYLYTYRQKSSFINDFITVQFVQEIPPKTPESNTETTENVTSPNKNEELDDTLSNMSPPNFESNVGDILKRFSIRRTTDFDIRDLLSDSSNNPFDDTNSTEETRKPKFSIVIYSRSKIDLKDTNEKRVKAWLNDFKKLVMSHSPAVQLCNSFQWE